MGEQMVCSTVWRQTEKRRYFIRPSGKAVFSISKAKAGEQALAVAQRSTGADPSPAQHKSVTDYQQVRGSGSGKRLGLEDRVIR
jgi:hypothetical protein